MAAVAHTKSARRVNQIRPETSNSSEAGRNSNRNLGPTLGRFFPSGSTSRLRPCPRRGRLRNPDWLLGRYWASQGRLVMFDISAVVFVVGEKRRSDPQCLYFFFQPNEFLFLLPQNLVNILHSVATCEAPHIKVIRTLCMPQIFVKELSTAGHKTFSCSHGENIFRTKPVANSVLS